MKLFNLFFYLLLFVGFFLPTNSNMYIPLPGVLLKVNELAFLLIPIINLLCTSKIKRFRVDKKIKKYITLYLLIIFVTEFIFKPLAFDQSIMDSFKAFRLGLPLYSSLILLLIGIKADIKTVWRVLLYAVGVSVVLSILSIFINIPIYYNIEEESILEFAQGRIINSNASFGIIGLYLLFTDKDKWYNKGRLVKYVSMLSVVALIISFNSTYLALLVLEFIYLSYKTFTLKTFYKLILYPALFLGVVFYAYNTFDTIQRQIDRRILSILYQETSLVESTIESNRDVIYEGIHNRIKEGYWVIGLPYDTPIFIRPKRYSRDEVFMNITDTSFANILLRYGVIPLLITIIIFSRLYKMNSSSLFRTLLILYLIASLNIDSLLRHNSIFFLIVIFIITNYKLNDKNHIYSKNRLKYRR